MSTRTEIKPIMDPGVIRVAASHGHTSEPAYRRMLDLQEGDLMVWAAQGFYTYVRVHRLVHGPNLTEIEGTILQSEDHRVAAQNLTGATWRFPAHRPYNSVPVFPAP